MLYKMAFKRTFKFCRNLFNISFTLRRQCTSKASEKVCVEKNIEEPVIVINEYDNVDIIGPPDKVSNLRPIIRRNLINGTLSQKKLCEMQNSTQEWNQKFWSEHNTKFAKERQEYIELYLKKSNEKQLTAEEMSEFYKKFLDENWQIHVRYNLEWYKKNFRLLLVALKVNVEKLTEKIR